MGVRFELLYGFVHCRGRTSYSAGYAESQEEAERWVRSHRDGLGSTPEIPPDDPVRCCKADLCPLRRQKPWYSAAAAARTPDQGAVDRAVPHEAAREGAPCERTNKG